MSSYANTICLVPDLGSWVLFPGKTEEETIYLVGSRQLDKYLTVPAQRYPLVMRILERLRLGYSPEQIEADFRTEGLAVNVREFCQMLASKNLIEWEVAKTTNDMAPNTRWGDLFGQLRALSWQVFSLRLDKIEPVLTRISTPMLGILIVSAVLSSIIVLLQGGISTAALREISNRVWEATGLFWIALANMLIFPVFVLLHESAHTIVAARGQVYPRQLSLRLYLLVAPYFSLQLPGLYTLPPGNRFMTILAGPLMDLILGNLCLLAAHAASGMWVAWFALMALSNYGRFMFNIMPILPMTDGYAFLSQALFREIDIRGHATKEFRRWRQKKPHNFRGKYVAFFALNVGVAAFVIVGGLIQVNAILIGWLKAIGLLPTGPLTWWTILALAVLDGLGLYLARSRLRILFAW